MSQCQICNSTYNFLSVCNQLLNVCKWKRTTTAKRSLETNLNELISTKWEIQIKWWSVFQNLGLVNICSYPIRITIETFTNLTQIRERKPLGKNELLKIWKFSLNKGIKLKCSINKRAILLPFYTNLPCKSYQWTFFTYLQ